MSKIVITVEIPDNSTVGVVQADSRPSVSPAPTPPPALEDAPWPVPVLEPLPGVSVAPAAPVAQSCRVHHQTFKWVPGGYSKTKVDENGQPKQYDGFWSCPTRDCKEKPR